MYLISKTRAYYFEAKPSPVGLLDALLVFTQLLVSWLEH